MSVNVFCFKMKLRESLIRFLFGTGAQGERTSFDACRKPAAFFGNSRTLYAKVRERFPVASRAYDASFGAGARAFCADASGVFGASCVRGLSREACIDACRVPQDASRAYDASNACGARALHDASRAYDASTAQETLSRLDLQWFANPEDEGRTEEASEHKIRKAREEGRVAKSQEVSGALVMLLPVLTLIFCGKWVFENCSKVVLFYFTRATEAELTDGSLVLAFYNFFIKMMLPVAVTALVAGIVGNVVQTRGFVFSTKPLEPKFSKILPKFGEYFKKTLFSFEGAFNVVKSIVKVAIIVFAAYLVIKNDLPKLLTLLEVNLWQGFTYIAGMAAKLLVIASVIFMMIAIPDYIVQRRQFMQSLKMTKQEVKEEYKELEGDPLVKSRLRQRMHEMMNQNMPRLVAEADVIITNPTHFACAVQYDKTTMPGPMLTAKGADSLAQRMKQIARDNDVPIVENRPLARALYAEVEIGDIIPETYYQALAVILAKVYTMNPAKSKMR